MDNICKFQYSFFLEGRESPQVVVRGNDYKQFILDVEQAKADFIPNRAIAGENFPEDTEIEEVMVDMEKLSCKTCYAPATLQEGIGKNGKPYKLLKCSKDYKHNSFI